MSFPAHKQRYGEPRLADKLPENNINTIAASMRRQELRAKPTRRFSPVRYRDHGFSVSENLLKPDFLNQWHKPEMGSEHHVSPHG